MDVADELSIDHPPVARATAAPRLIISVELAVYVVLILFSLAWRLPELGTIPPGDVEAHEALAAFQAVGTAPVDSALVAHNPLMFTANTLAMTLVGTDTATARLPTIFVAVLLIGMPILFRRWLGNVPALLTSALLAISSVLFIASRTMSGPVWSIALALLAIYFVGRFIEARTATYAVAATTLFFLLLLMAEPAGFITFLGLLAGVLFALATTDDPDNSFRNTAGATLRSWPWLRALVSAGVVIGLLSTVFLLDPRGFATIGELASQAVKGLVVRPADYPILFPLRTSLLYEPVLWLFGLLGAYQVLRSDAGGVDAFIKRAAVGWLFISFLASIFYPGAAAAHALWFTLPLAVLSASAIEKMLIPVRERFWTVPSWGPGLHALATLGMLLIAGVNLVIIGRAWMGTLPTDHPAADPAVTSRLLFEAPAIMLIVITFFLVASMWGSRAAWRGIGIGTLALLCIFSLGTAWRAGVVNADDPREFWQVRPAARNLNLLESTLVTASRRVTGMPYDIDMVVQTDPQEPQDGALAWALRRFHNAQYVTELAPTLKPSVILLPASADKPAVAANYVGQDFPVYYTWQPNELSWDTLTWLYDRGSRMPPEGDGRMIVWVRNDVYGVPQDSPVLPLAAPGTVPGPTQ